MQITPEVKAKFELEFVKRIIEKLPLGVPEKQLVVSKIDAEITKVYAEEVMKDAVPKRK